MIGRVTAASIQHYSSKLRHHMNHGVSTLRHVGRHLNNAYNVGKIAYKTIQPLLKEMAPAIEGRATKALEGASSGYEYLRDKAAAVDAVGSQIKANLRSKQTEMMPY